MISNSPASSSDRYSESFVRETASILVRAYELNLVHWIWHLAVGWEGTVQEIVENWIRGYVRQVSPAMADAMFQVLLLEFEKLYFNKEVCHEVPGV